MNYLRNAAALSGCAAIFALIGCGGGGAGYGGNGGSTSGGGGATTYTVGGSVSGLSSGESVSLQNNGGDTYVANASGTFSFHTSLAAGSAYAATVLSHTPGITCAITSGSGTVGSANVTGISVSCSPGTERVLYSFNSSSGDALSPSANLIMDKNGNLYGTSAAGGANAAGAVFKVSASGAESVLYSFGASTTDGAQPFVGLVMDSSGNLYGTTLFGGANGKGAAFKIDSTGKESILHSFGATATDGQAPNSSLLLDNGSGNLYGTTISGGANGKGTVYQIDNTGKETVIYSFGASANDAATPQAGLSFDDNGNLLGTTQLGGVKNEGTVFKVDTTGKETVIYSFGATATDASNPTTSPIVSGAGNIYGTTPTGGANNKGAVYKIDSTGTESVLYSFGANVTDGSDPISNLLLDPAGNLYGTTSGGGTNGKGTVFKIDSTGAETVLYSFGANSSDGTLPRAGVIADGVGNLYGTTSGGSGTVFVIN